MALTEQEFRKRVQETFDRIEQGFSEVDPDIAECEQSFGAMTITLADRSRCILSTQPAVRQLWLALASKGTAYHFTYDLDGQRWIDDKGRGVELLAFLKNYLGETTHVRFEFT